MNQKQRYSSFALKIASVLFFLSLAIMLWMSLLAQIEKHQIEKRYHLASRFYEIDINHELIYSLTDSIVKLLENREAISFNKKHMEEVLQKSCFDYRKMKENYAQTMPPRLSDKIQADVYISHFHVFTSDTSITFYETKNNYQPLIIQKETSRNIKETPDVSFYYRGKNYHVQISANIHESNVYLYYLNKLKYNILLSFILLIIFALLIRYTGKVLRKQFELNELKDDFINNITHEIKTPISTSLIAIRNIQLKYPEATKETQILERQNKLLNEHMDRIMNLSLLQDPNNQLNFESVNIHILLNNIYSDYSINIISLTYIADSQHLDFCLNADPVYFRIMISNLIENAIKYSDNKNIVLSWLIDNNKLLINVNDKGIGIGKEHQKLIFEKFYRVPHGNIHKVKGSGLGLHYVSLIAKAHGASISVESSLNEGSCFQIQFPI